jgi:hypothetical protein
MIDDLDEALRRLLVRELPVKKSEIDIKFDQPSREWSAKLTRPTLDLFLYDIRENVKLRQPAPGWSETREGDNVVMKQRPFRVDLFYAITAWAREPEDEHRLLTRTLLALFRTKKMPEDVLPESLRDQPFPIKISVVQHESLQNPSDFWSALDNEIRPALPCNVTISLDPYQPIETPIVAERELKFFDLDGTRPLDTVRSAFWTVGGTLHSSVPLRQVHMTLVEMDREVQIQRSGDFTIKGLAAGEYTLEVSIEDGEPKQHRIVVPSPDYDLEV